MKDYCKFCYEKIKYVDRIKYGTSPGWELYSMTSYATPSACTKSSDGRHHPRSAA